MKQILLIPCSCSCVTLTETGCFVLFCCSGLVRPLSLSFIILFPLFLSVVLSSISSSTILFHIPLSSISIFFDIHILCSFWL